MFYYSLPPSKEAVYQRPHCGKKSNKFHSKHNRTSKNGETCTCLHIFNYGTVIVRDIGGIRMKRTLDTSLLRRVMNPYRK